MDLKNQTSSLMTLIGFLWVAITIMGWGGYWFPAMFLGIILMLIHMMLGAAKEGNINKKLMIFPFVPWAVLWAVSFGLSYYYGNLFQGRMPDFTILGFHPSFAWTIITYWIGGMVTLTLGFVVQKDLWLTDHEWEEFKRKIIEINQEQGGINSDINS